MSSTPDLGEQFNENLQSILKTPEELEVPDKAILAAKKTITEPETKKEEKANAPKSSVRQDQLTVFKCVFNLDRP